MKYHIILIIFLLVLSIFGTVSAQSELTTDYEKEGIAHLTRLLNLKPSDLTFREDYAEIDSLRLAIISELTVDPYGIVEFTENMAENCRSKNPTKVINSAFENLRLTIQDKREYAIVQDGGGLSSNYTTFYSSVDFNSLLSKMNDVLYYDLPASVDSTMAFLSAEEQKFLKHEFKEIIFEDTADESRTAEIIDSIQKAEEGYIDKFKEFAYKIRKDFLLDAGRETSEMVYNEIIQLLGDIEKGVFNVPKVLSDTITRPSRPGLAKYLGLRKGWAIGGPGNNRYRGDYHFILDFGGDDFYQLEYDPDKPHSTIIIDLSGDDVYVSETDFTIGSGCFSVGLLFDMAGNDTYNGGNFSCGSGYFGFGLLYDKSGTDRYNGDTFTQGAATCGIGMIYDCDGSDVYSAAVNAQGFALMEGFGLIVDQTGNDNYYLGGKYKAIIHYDDHYLSIGQGYGGGLMMFVSGGIGGIIDLAGNDNYYSDMVAQGCGWWYALGFIYDYSGNDQYLSYQYGQGSAEHMGLGIIIDESGQDFYRGKGLMQGVGHDYSCGILLDRHGDDIYQAQGLSQGAGSANGIGILIDSHGNDIYYVRDTINTQGYGNPRRDFGSIGLFLDLSGTDIYDGNGLDNSYWTTGSKWGGGFDWEFITKSDSSKVEAE
ncbi:MAG: hypothetical protein GY865_13110 [candidate division Zixibacteria bacterium]|nr:hypothetical protein [candidate division Zixibacteria bacterium]